MTPQATDLRGTFAVWLTTFVVILPVAFSDVVVFDEGFIATGAMLLRRGALPYRDFFAIYGPGEYVTHAFLFTVLGEDLGVLRLSHAALLASLTATVYRLSVDLSGRRRAAVITAVMFALAVIIAKPNAGYPALSSTLFLLLGIRPFGTYTVTSRPLALLRSSLALAAAATIRWDMGLFGFIGLILSCGVALRHDRRRFIIQALPLVVGTGAVVAAIYGLFLITADIRRWVDEVPYYLLFEVYKWRAHSYIGPLYDDLSAGLKFDVRRLLWSGYTLAYGAGPVLALLASILTLIRRARQQSDEHDERVVMQALFLTILGLLLLMQFRLRPDAWHAIPVCAAASPLVGYAKYRLSCRPQVNRHFARLVHTCVAVTAVVFVTLGFSSLRRAVMGAYVPTPLSKATFVRLPPNKEYYPALVAYIRRETGQNELIFSGVADTSRLYINDALIYFLTDRHPATRHVEMEPAIANSESGQLELIDSLSRHKVPLVVLLAQYSTEPNLTSSSNGVHLLDEFITSRYIEVARFGPYTVMKLSRRFQQ